MNRPSVAAAFAASLLFGAVSQGAARDLPWGIGAEVASPYGALAADASLRDHLNFIHLASVNHLLARRFAIELELERFQPIIPLAAPVPPPVSTGPVSEAVLALGRAEADRLLGDGEDDLRLQTYLPFQRRMGVSGVISGGSLSASAVAAGVPAPALLEVMQALETSVDLKQETRDGDRFYVRYEQTFTQSGAPLDVGRVLWMELRSAKGALAIHRFRMRDNSERFWMASGQAATPPSFRMPLDTVSISSGFGLRADPFDQPPPSYGGKPQGAGGPKLAKPLPPGLPTGGATDRPRAGASAAPPPGLSSYGNSSYGSASYGNSSYGNSSYGGFRAPPAYVVPSRPSRSLFMHEGVDLVAPTGTPVVAAADGIVVGAAPNGRYGNWVRLEHGGKLATVYGHLSAFASGLQPGMVVSRGDVIGYVGSTGRSTGAHLHFELQLDGKPVNPITHPELKRAQLRGPDLERFRKQLAASRAERDLETTTAAASIGD